MGFGHERFRGAGPGFFAEEQISSRASFRSRRRSRASARSIRSPRLPLKLTAPGVPDIYQGSEIWNFSLVDPDNRRPVDYRAAPANARSRWRRASPEELLRTMAGWAHQIVPHPAACSVFAASIRLCSTEEIICRSNVSGTFADCCIAFAREHEGQMDGGARAAAFLARGFSADRREMAGHGGRVAGGVAA